MSESETKSSEAEASESNGASPASAPPASKDPPSASPEAKPESTAAPVPDAPPPDPLETAKAEAQKFREQLLRTAADFDNFRKRSRREQEEAQRRGKESALKELLPVFDNLERATQSAETAPDAKSVADGLRMVTKQFVSTLDRLGIKRVATIGQPFDPALHEAIQHVESKEYPAGVIAIEVQAGYSYGDHLVRAALVAVSKGPPAEASAEAAPTDDTAKASEESEPAADASKPSEAN
jgi:molecular chaperone GrpE